MPRTRPLLTLLLAAALLPASARALVTPAAVAPGAVPLASLNTASMDARVPAARAAAWASFESRHGRWSVMWDRATGTPHRAFGPSFALPGAANDAASVEGAVRAFVASEPGLFGAPDLELVSAVRARETWYVRFRERVNGLPVLFADWEFRVGANGALVAFGADAMRDVPAEALTAPKLAASVLRAAATNGLRFDPATDDASGAGELALLPVRTENGVVLRPVATVEIVTQDPPARWVTLVDAATGEVRLRFDRVRHAITGTVTGQVHADLPTDPLTSVPFKNQWLTIGGSFPVTDASGFYSFAAGVTSTVTARLEGPFVNVNRQNGTDASQSSVTPDPGVANFTWTTVNSQDAERDAFRSVNIVHDYIKGLDPAMTALDYSMPCAVNINDVCNAFWDGTGINFYLAGGGCPNTASMPDVVFHEYGHGINDQLYAALGQPFGMVNGALHEGTADVNACLLLDTPLVGRGFTGVGTVLRNTDNTNTWPDDDGEAHFAGLIVGGAMWDLREAIGLAPTRLLAHFSRYGTPDDFDNGVAMHEYFVEVLVADDDDANLANGTPHFAEIVSAFNAHGIGTGFFTTIVHGPLSDTPDHGPYRIAAVVQYSGPFGALAANGVTLHYSVDNGPFQGIAMTPTGVADEYQANLPALFTGIVRYYLTATDVYGGVAGEPYGAPFRGNHLFLAGPFATQFSNDMETTAGWIAGGAGDNATSGAWTRSDPVGAYVGSDASQPEDDHSPAGAQCWITGNAAAGAAAGTNDVDGGHVTLVSSSFDATGMTDPLIEYWYWYRNDLGGAPASDTFHVAISNDGGTTWTPVFEETSSAGEWRRALFFVSDVVTPTANLQLRFRASDYGAGSLVEAGVDDLRLLAVPSTTDVPTATPAALSLAAGPNPFAGTLSIRWSLPVAGEASLAVYDVGGRLVRTLERGAATAGAHVSSWDGRDDAGHAARAGTYWLRLQAGAIERTRTVVRVR